MNVIDDLFKNLNINSDSNEKIELLKSLSDTLKKLPSNLKNTFIHEDLFTFLINALSKTTIKDVSRKLVTRCVNLMTINENEIYYQIVKSSLFELLNSKDESIGQKLFVLNIFIENLNEFGNKCLMNIRSDCLNVFIKLSLEAILELKNSTAPITVRNAAQNLQWIFKTKIALLQKCFKKEDFKVFSETFKTINNLTIDTLSLKETYNTELGSSAAMVFVLVNTLDENPTKRSFIEKMLIKAENNTIIMRDLCIFQAILTMIKSHQLIEEKLFDLFIKVLDSIIENSNECNESTQIIQVTRSVNLWTIKLAECIGIDKDYILSLSHIISSQKLLNFIWSNFDSSIDVVRYLNIQSYENTIKSITRLSSSADQTSTVRER